MSDFRIVATAELDEVNRMLISKATDALDGSYAPYSNFHVASALLLDDGSVVTGTNQENAAYPSGLCAERVALYAMASQHPGRTISRLIVLARRHGDDLLSPATSCGGCRQVMLEFESRQKVPYAVVMYYGPDQWVIASSAESLLPYCFTKSNLDK